MKIKHKICGNLTEKQVVSLKKYGLDFTSGEVSCLVVSEDDRYHKLKNIIREYEMIDFMFPEFDKNEVKNSLYSVINNIIPSGGYPMPDNIDYQAFTYNTDSWCRKCGSGLKLQKAPFKLKKAPIIKRKIFGIHWKYDVLFAEKEYYKEILEPLNIGYKDVLLYKGDKIIDNIVQVLIPEIDEELDLSNYDYENCNACGIKKFNPMPLDFFPIQKKSLSHLYLSKEYFGSGASANKKIFISKYLREQFIKDKCMNWDWFIPCNAPSKEYK